MAHLQPTQGVEVKFAHNPLLLRRWPRTATTTHTHTHVALDPKLSCSRVRGAECVLPGFKLGGRSVLSAHLNSTEQQASGRASGTACRPDPKLIVCLSGYSLVAKENYGGRSERVRSLVCCTCRTTLMASRCTCSGENTCHASEIQTRWSPRSERSFER